MCENADSKAPGAREFSLGGTWRLIVLITAVSIACANGQTRSAKPIYYIPPDDSDGSIATICGDHMLVTKLVSFPFAIDGLRVEDAASSWRRRVPIRAEPHAIAAEITNQGRMEYYARVDLRLDARPGANYLIRFNTELGNPAGPTFCDVWIVDGKTGVAASSVVRASFIKKIGN